MIDLDFLKKLTIHGGKLIGRIILIFLPVIAYSFWEMIKRGPGISSKEEAENAFAIGKISFKDMIRYEDRYGD